MRIFHPVYILLLFMGHFLAESDLILGVFSKPAARMAGIFLGTPMLVKNGGYLLNHPILPVLVTSACSGFGFFMLLVVLVASTSKSVSIRSQIQSVVKWIPLLVLLALFTNTIRIICGFYVGIFSRSYLPDFLWGGFHLATGVFVFVPVLFAFNYYLERSDINE